jgi:hypothetical protein
MMQRSCFLFLFSFLCCNPLSAQQIKSPEGFMLKLSEEQATKFAGLALKNIHREYPSKPGNVLESSKDVLSPKQLYPAFHGCYDWHSSVHGHWMLVKILKEFPQLKEAEEIRKALAKNITKENLLAEAAFFRKTLWLVMVFKTYFGTSLLGRPVGERTGTAFETPRGNHSRALHSIFSQTNLPHPEWGAFQHGFWIDVCS